MASLQAVCFMKETNSITLNLICMFAQPCRRVWVCPSNPAPLARSAAQRAVPHLRGPPLQGPWTPCLESQSAWWGAPACPTRLPTPDTGHSPWPWTPCPWGPGPAWPCPPHTPVAQQNKPSPSVAPWWTGPDSPWRGWVAPKRFKVK